MMAINTTPKEKPAGGRNPTAGAINTPNSRTKAQAVKDFHWVERWGFAKLLPTIDAARRFLEQGEASHELQS